MRRICSPADAATRRRLIGALGAGTLAVAVPRAALAQAWPSRPITMIIGFPPGGGLDNLGRLLAERMARDLGQNIVVDNKPGAGGTIASGALLRAGADGHAILLGNVGQFSIAQHLMKTPPVDPVRQFAPVGQIGNAPLALFVPADSPAKTAVEFVALARAKPDGLTYGSGGLGQITHLAFELLKADAQLKITHVPYKGSAPAVTDLLGGRIDAIIDAIGVGVAHVRAGRLKMLAVTSAERVAEFPDVPTLRESAVPGFSVSGWQALVAPAGTPVPVIERLNAALNAALTDPALVPRLIALGYYPAPGTPEAFGTLMRSDADRWGAVVKRAGIEAQ